MSEVQKLLAALLLGTLIGGLAVLSARAQAIQPLQPLASLGGGYSLTPDGGVSSWQDGSGYIVAPSGNSSWSPDGGYSISPDGGVSSWSGPVIQLDGPVLAPIPLDPQ